MSDVDGINRVFYDVLNHRLNMERDGVMTFENFRLLNESLIDLEKGKFKYKKVLADLYKAGTISFEAAISKTSKPDEVQRLIGATAPAGAKLR